MTYTVRAAHDLPAIVWSAELHAGRVVALLKNNALWAELDAFAGGVEEALRYADPRSRKARRAIARKLEATQAA